MIGWFMKCLVYGDVRGVNALKVFETGLYLCNNFCYEGEYS